MTIKYIDRYSLEIGLYILIKCVHREGWLNLVFDNSIYSGKPKSQGVFFRKSLRNNIHTKIVQ